MTSLNLTFIGPPLPVTERGSPTKVYVHKDGDTIIYGNRTAVVARSVSDPMKMPTVYTQHRSKVTVARFSPNGNYVASGDESGKVRVWAFTHEENLLTKEVSTVSGGVRDLDWDGEGKRIVACGQGERKAYAFTWDTGSELGKMTGVANTARCCAFKSCRPYRIILGCEDSHAFFFKGPPFKHERTNKEHKNMVTGACFAPDGSKFVTVGSDKQAHMYDGKSGEPIGKLSFKKKVRHNATIYAVDFSPDGETVLTASSDKTCKLWQAASGDLVTTLRVGAPKPQIRDQQVAGFFTASGPASLSLCGEINIFNPEEPDAPARVIHGHQATPVALAVGAAGEIFTGDQEGVLCRWVAGVARRVNGVVDAKDNSKVHKGGIQGVSLHGDGILSAGVDGAINFIDAANGELTATENAGAPVVATATGSANTNVSVIITASEELISVVDGTIASKVALDGEPFGVALSADGTRALVTVPRSRKLHFFSVGADGALAPDGDAVTLDEAPRAVAISADGNTIVVGEGSSVSVIDASSRDITIQGYFLHTATVTTLDVTANGDLILSGAKDGALSLWKPADKKFRCSTQAHFQGVIAAKFVSETEVVSVGVDRCLRRYSIGEVDESAGGASKP